MENCGDCHQAKGRGIPGAVPPLAGNGAVVAIDPADVINVVLGGSLQGGKYAPMPSFAQQLTDVQIADIANYLRANWGNAEPPNATADAVSKLQSSVKKLPYLKVRRNTAAVGCCCADLICTLSHRRKSAWPSTFALNSLGVREGRFGCIPSSICKTGTTERLEPTSVR